MRVLATSLFAGFLAVSAHAFEIAPGAIVLGDAVFLRSADGTAAAHAVATGARRWSSTEPARPLAARGNRLLVQVPSDPAKLGLAFLEAATGRRLAQVAVDLPAGASAPLDDTGDTQFRVRIEPAGDLARLEWSWAFRPMRGAYEEDVDDGARRAEGALLVDLAAGRVETGPAPETHPLPDAIAREADAGAFRERPFRIGALFVATQEGPAAPILKRWSDAAVPLPDVALPDGVTLQLGSADRRHVLVSRELPGEPLAAAHEWTVLALDTGARVASLRAPTAAAGFVVAGDRVLVVQQAWEHRTGSGWQRDPRRLEAFDRASGAPGWVQEIRDHSYLGPVAP